MLRPSFPCHVVFVGVALALLLSGRQVAARHVQGPPASQASSVGHLSRFGAGDGPSHAEGTYRLLDAARTLRQSNAVAFDREHEGARESLTLRCRLRVLEGGDGGAVVFLNTAEFGARGPAPFVRSWVEPNLAGTFAVGIDVHNPVNEEPFGPWGNYLGRPEREVSLHWDGRELVKRAAEDEFRGDFVDVEVSLVHVPGGAEVSVRLGSSAVYERTFVPGLLPYESRLAFGAGTRDDATTEFDVADVVLEAGEPAAPRRRPLHVELFNHVLTDNSKTAFEVDVDLPPASWAFGRVLLTLQIHDAGAAWDEWDRNGELSIQDDDGTWWGLVPFITSYRTECHWVVDLTHFRPLLTGTRRFRLAAGTTFYKNRGYMLSASLDFHHGTPVLGGAPREPYRVVPLWHGTASYKSAENHFQDFYPPQSVEVDDAALAARVFVTTTGHSQVGEFTPSERAVVFVADASAASPDEQRFENTLWKTDCYLNPNRPQLGTWKYARAGWAPGDIVWPWWIDLTPHLVPGATAAFRYEPKPYDFGDGEAPTDDQVHQASHVVRAYLILYRAPGGLAAAPTLRVGNVTGGSSAATAGIVVGDYLASYDGVIVDTVAELGAAKAAALEAGKETVPVVIYRGAERLELEMASGQMGVNLSGG